MKTIEYTNSKLNKESWGKGEWLNEPDKKQWLDKETGLACLINRSSSGAWCGYVGVKEDHPYFQKHYDDNDVNVEVHWGLTFSGHCQQSTDESQGVCHKVDDEDKVWWLGFDCGHSGDLCPGYKSIFKITYDQYRNINYVTSQVEYLAKQLKEINHG